MSTVDYDKIWEVYEISQNQDLYHNARQTIRRYWNAYLKELGKPEKFPWTRLSECEQDAFIYQIIYDTMIANYVPMQAEKRVKMRVENYIAQSMQTVDERIREKNMSIKYQFRDHRTTTHSDAKKQEAYKALCRDIQAYNTDVPLPTYEEFEKELSLNAAVCPEEAEEADYETRVQDREMVYRDTRLRLERIKNGVARDDEETRAKDRASAEAAVRAEDERKAKGAPIRAYDYIAGYEDIMNNRWLPVDGAESIYLRIILKVLEEKLGLKVDYDMIIQCLLCRAKFSEYCRQKDIDLDGFGKLRREYVDSEDEYVESKDSDEPSIVYMKFPIEYDENMDMSVEEFEELKRRYAEYLSCQKKLNDLKPLYKYEKKD